jgi:hypothetical protein
MPIHDILMSHVCEKIAAVNMLLGCAEATSPMLQLHEFIPHPYISADGASCIKYMRNISASLFDSEESDRASS